MFHRFEKTVRDNTSESPQERLDRMCETDVLLNLQHNILDTLQAGLDAFVAEDKERLEAEKTRVYRLLIALLEEKQLHHDEQAQDIRQIMICIRLIWRGKQTQWEAAQRLAHTLNECISSNQQ
jgi:hypothetical protein